MAPYSATSWELSGAAKASLRLGLGHPLYAPWACSLLPPPSVRLSLVTEATAYLITISSSSIDSLVTHARLACSLPYTWAILPHIQTNPTPFWVVAGSKPRASPSSISRSSTFYLGRSRILQSSYTSRRLADRIRITVDGIRIRSYLPRTIAYAAEQLH